MKNSVKIGMNLTFIGILLLCLLGNISYTAGAGYTVTPFSAQSWCTSAYPTSYATVNFSINESNVKSFKKDQNNQTIILTLPADFEFNTSEGTVTYASGGDITGINVISFTTTSITIGVTIPKNGGDDMDTLFFNNFQVYAIASGSSGSLLRDGGSFKIDGKTDKPKDTESLGDLDAQEPMTYLTSEVVQANTSLVNQSSVNNEIVSIIIEVEEFCNAFTVTQFNFNTDGSNDGSDNAGVDISTAKVYYTGQSGTFATTNLFGTYSNPNGAFNITGLQTLSDGEGDYYFWLTYDITLTATAGNRVDAICSSFEMDGTRIPTTTDPGGSRTINAITNYYSRFTGNWTTADIWSNTDGGPSCSCEPDSAGRVIIDTNHTITLDAARTIDVIEIHDGAVLTGNKSLNVNSAFDTYGSGYFNMTGQITVNGNMTLSGTGASSNSKNINVGGNLNVGPGTNLEKAGGGADVLSVAGNLTVDDTIIMNNNNFELDGGNSDISGSGSIIGTGSVIITAGNKTVLSGTNLVIGPKFSIEGAYTIINNGILTLENDLTGDVASSKWINAANSTLKIAGSFLTAGAGGILDASASGNTIEYHGSGDQTIKIASSNYYHLILSTGGTKFLAANIEIDGNLTITGVTLDVTGNNYNINLAGDWNNTGTLIEQNATLTFDGSGSQSITNTSGETFYNLTVDKSFNDLTINDNITIDNILALTNGDILLNSNDIIISTSASISGGGPASYIQADDGTGTLKKMFNVPDSLTYPVGDGTYYTPFVLKFNSGTFGGGAFVTVRIWDDVHPNNAYTDHISRYWIVTPSGITSPNYNISCTYVDADIIGTKTNMKPQRWDGSAWTAYDAVNAATNALTGSGITSFSNFTGGGGAPLPIELLFFDVKLNQDEGVV